MDEKEREKKERKPRSHSKSATKSHSSSVRSDDKGTGVKKATKKDSKKDESMMSDEEAEEATRPETTKPPTKVQGQKDDDGLSKEPDGPAAGGGEEESDDSSSDEAESGEGESSQEDESEEAEEETKEPPEETLAQPEIEEKEEEEIVAAADARTAEEPPQLTDPSTSTPSTLGKQRADGSIIPRDELTETGLIQRPELPPRGDEIPQFAKPLTRLEEPFKKWVGPLPEDQLQMLDKRQNRQGAEVLSKLYRTTKTETVRLFWEEKRHLVPEGTVVDPPLKATEERDCFVTAKKYLDMIDDPDPLVWEWDEKRPREPRRIVPQSVMTTPDCLREGMAYAHGEEIPPAGLPMDDITMPLLRSFPPSYNPDDLEERLLREMTPPDHEIGTGEKDPDALRAQTHVQLRLFKHNHVAEDLGIAHMDLGTARHAMTKTLQMLPSNTEAAKVYDGINSTECVLALRAAVRAGQEAAIGDMAIVGFSVEYMSSIWSPAQLHQAREFLNEKMTEEAMMTRPEEIVKKFLDVMGYPEDGPEFKKDEITRKVPKWNQRGEGNRSSNRKG